MVCRLIWQRWMFPAHGAVMSLHRSASQILDSECLSIRSKLIDLAAVLDRLDKAEDAAVDDPRILIIRNSLEVLADSAADRAERVQRLFSLPYDADWQKHW
jgi:hypothetical protein